MRKYNSEGPSYEMGDHPNRVLAECFGPKMKECLMQADHASAVSVSNSHIEFKETGSSHWIRLGY
jgi:hypothetical protein